MQKRNDGRRSIRSGKSLQSLSKRSGSATSSLQAEEVDSQELASEIMQEILSNALTEIHEKYMERQLIRFVVHCAHQALMKALRIHFYQHNDYIRNARFWGSEKRVDPSSPDSWAIDQVLLSDNISAEQEISTLSQITLAMASQPLSVHTDGDLISQPSESLIQDVRNMLEEIIDGLPVMEEEKTEEQASTVSAFTMVVEGIQHYKEYEMKPQLSKISLDDVPFKLPKIDLPDSGNSRRYQSTMDLASLVEISKLPPIRTDANYKSHTQPPAPQEEKPKKKK